MVLTGLKQITRVNKAQQSKYRALWTILVRKRSFSLKLSHTKNVFEQVNEPYRFCYTSFPQSTYFSLDGVFLID